MDILSSTEKISKPWYRKWWGMVAVLFAFIALSLCFAFGMLVYKISQESTANYKAFKEKERVIANRDYPDKNLIEGANNPWTGNPDAKIIIVEFADFSCSQCKASYSTVKEVLKKYGNDIKFIHRDYPVIADFSMNLAHAARCANAQGLFWPMHDKLFEQQPVEDMETVRKMANQLGADMATFDECTEKSKYLIALQKNFSDATALNLAGTPTWFINGHRLEGDMPFSTFEEIIKELKQ